MTEKNYQPPEFRKEAFHCPHCRVFANQKWFGLMGHQGSQPMLNFSKRFLLSSWNVSHSSVEEIHISKCEFSKCRKECVWVNGEMLFPVVNEYPPANDDMPDYIKKIYDEAGVIAKESPRAAAALLRLALQELCKTLECEGDNLRKQIERLAESKKVSSDVIQAADMVRLVGNDALHPDRVGDVDLENATDVVEDLFEFVNWVVKEGISDPKVRGKKIARFSVAFPESKKIKPQNGEKP